MSTDEQNHLKSTAPGAESPTCLNRCVYVVSNWPGGGNDRVKKILRLRDRFEKLVLVTPGDHLVENDTTMMVPRITNPLGILRVLGRHRLKQSIERYLYFPSMHILFAYGVRRYLSQRVAADLAAGRQVTLLTTAPPHALGLIGLYVKQHNPEVRWIMDWQDLWSYDENYYLTTPTVYRSRLRNLERRMLDAADLNLTTNEIARDVLADNYRVPPQRLLHIHHHFDREEFHQTGSMDREQTTQSPDKVRIGFLGSLFKPPRVPGMQVVDALEEIRREGIDVELHVHGSVAPEIIEQLRDIESVHLHGRVSHEESVNRLAEYDYLLLLLSDLPNSKAVMSIKLPHYMVVDRPILAIVPDQSAIADIVRKTGTGVVLPVAEDWQGMLRDLLQNPDRVSLPALPDPEAIEAFAWSNLARRWISAISGEPEIAW